MIENDEFGIKYLQEDINIGKVGVDKELLNLQKLLTATDNNLDILMYLSHKTLVTSSTSSTDTLDNTFNINKTYSVIYLPDSNNSKFIFIDPDGFPEYNNIKLEKGKTYRFIQFTGSNRSGNNFSSVNLFDLFFRNL